MAALAALSPQTRAALQRARAKFAPPERMKLTTWAETRRKVATGARQGAFRFASQPVFRGIAEAYEDPSVREITCQKSSQIGWTTGIELNVIGYHIDIDPCPILAVFAKDGAGKRFAREKLDPTIEATPVLAAKIPTEARNPNNTQDYKGFTGGFLQLVGTNSPSNVKSTDARVVLVIEPDDVSKDVKGQGDAIALGRERNKSFHNRKTVIGGTPTLDKFSNIVQAMERSDKRQFFVACPHCGHEQPLSWERVTWQSDALVHHPVYGTHRPETARYACEGDECGVLWTDFEKNEAIRRAAGRPDRGWRATAAFNDVAGFYLSELHSVFDGARIELIVRKYLEADAKLKEGDNRLMVAFFNNQLGQAYKIKSDAPAVEALRARADDYAEFSCPAGGLIATAGVDVQHDRLAVIIRAWGRGEESWLVYWGEIAGNPLEFTPTPDGAGGGAMRPPVWDALDKLLARPIRNAGGGVLGVSAYSVDSGDGQTCEAVYRHVRGRRDRAMAIKGSSRIGARAPEIFAPPAKAIDTQANDRAARWGLRVFMVGTDRAKDLIAGRLRLKGQGPGRIHWYASVREDYLPQLTSEVKFSARGGHPAWILTAGARNEALDGEVYALHAARRLRLHTWTDAQWTALEARVRQRDLVNPTDAPARVEAAVERKAGALPAVASDDWNSRL